MPMKTVTTSTHGTIWPSKPSVLMLRLNPVLQPSSLWQMNFCCIGSQQVRCIRRQGQWSQCIERTIGSIGVLDTSVCRAPLLIRCWGGEGQIVELWGLRNDMKERKRSWQRHLLLKAGSASLELHGWHDHHISASVSQMICFAFQHSDLIIFFK